jgi:hypothetical protein
VPFIEHFHLRLVDLLLGGISVVFVSAFRSPSAWNGLESMALDKWIVPRLLTCLSLGDVMVPNEGIMAHPIG